MELLNATQKEGEEKKEEETCSICLEALNDKMQMFTTSCGHNFHIECIKQAGDCYDYKNNEFSCPLCREPVNCIEIDDNDKKKLFRAIDKGDVEKVILIVTNNKELTNEIYAESEGDYHGYTPLMHTLRCNMVRFEFRYSIANFFINKLNRVELMKQSNNTSSTIGPQTALEMTIDHRRVESAISIINKLDESDLNQKPGIPFAKTLLILAIIRANERDTHVDAHEIVKSLIEKGVDLNYPQPRTPLVEAIDGAKDGYINNIYIIVLLIKNLQIVNNEALKAINKKIKNTESIQSKIYYKAIRKEIKEKLPLKKKPSKAKKFLSMIDPKSTSKRYRTEVTLGGKKKLKKKKFESKRKKFKSKIKKTRYNR